MTLFGDIARTMRRILIVDDDEAIRELYKHVFTARGYEVETAENGKDGLEKVPVFIPDCVLLDITMPIMTGVEFARKLRQDPDPRLRKIPFVVLTGESHKETSLQDSFQRNTSRMVFLSKMTTPKTVTRIVQNILELRK